jgi:CelD/BcsL family acetyltransferase involved in cellulose biosynthesis
MKYTVVPLREMDDALRLRWEELRAANPGLASPYYSWDYMAALVRVGREVVVTVVEDPHHAVAFFPFERAGRNITPPGSFLNDYQGLVASPDTHLDAHALLQASGARAYHFNHLPSDQQVFLPWAPIKHISPVMNLSGGWEAYLGRLAAQQGRKVPGIVGRVRERLKIARRSFQDIRLEFTSANHAHLDWLMKQKSAQYRQTPGAVDIFAIDWVRRLMHDLLDTETPHFRGRMSCLWGDESLLACHLGLESDGLLHAWFPTYAPEHAAMSPGLVLFHEMARLAPDHGIWTIDLGRGVQDYKLRLMTHSVPLREGLITRPQCLGQARMGWWQARTWLREQPWARAAHRQIRTWMNPSGAA